MQARKAAFRNLGCKVNEYEMEYMQQKMAECGYEIVPFDAYADVYVVNTCTVTNIADRKSRQMLHQAKKRNPDALVVAVGCYVETDREGVLRDDAVDLCIGNRGKKDLPGIIADHLNEVKGSQSRNPYPGDEEGSGEYENMLVPETTGHERAYIKIEDGCNQFCSYCAIPYARGRVRSRKLGDIREEAQALADHGYKEVILTGIHLSSYGLDRHGLNYNEVASGGGYTNHDLLEAMETIDRISGIQRIRLSSLEPRLITEEFLRELSRIGKFCPHFHLSLQSGCRETLLRMNRKYTPEEYAEGVSMIRSFFVHPAVTTDVITGFPGETEEEFGITRDFLRKTAFADMHIFPYSRRRGTAAANMPDQVNDRVKKERSAQLLALAKELSAEFRRFYIGREAEVLFEEYRKGRNLGHTREYVMLAMEKKEDLTGRIITGKVARYTDEMLFFEA